jgi:hypothetical protein
MDHASTLSRVGLLREGDLLSIIPDFHLTTFTQRDGVVMSRRRNEGVDGSLSELVDLMKLICLPVKNQDSSSGILNIESVFCDSDADDLCMISSIWSVRDENLLNWSNCEVDTFLGLSRVDLGHLPPLDPAVLTG